MVHILKVVKYSNKAKSVIVETLATKFSIKNAKRLYPDCILEYSDRKKVSRDEFQWLRNNIITAFEKP